MVLENVGFANFKQILFTIQPQISVKNVVHTKKLIIQKMDVIKLSVLLINLDCYLIKLAKLVLKVKVLVQSTHLNA